MCEVPPQPPSWLKEEPQATRLNQRGQQEAWESLLFGHGLRPKEDGNGAWICGRAGARESSPWSCRMGASEPGASPSLIFCAGLGSVQVV